MELMEGSQSTSVPKHQRTVIECSLWRYSDDRIIYMIQDVADPEGLEVAGVRSGPCNPGDMICALARLSCTLFSLNLGKGARIHSKASARAAGHIGERVICRIEMIGSATPA